MSQRRNRQPRFDSRDDLLDGAAATLDLHGRTAAEARPMVRAFIATQARNARGSVVHIITGKGRGSPSPDVDEGGFVVRLR